VTGPAPGKFPLKAKVWFLRGFEKNLIEDAEIYLHLKGYSLARVTHMDLEHQVFNYIVPPGKAKYLDFKVRKGKIVLLLDRSYSINLQGKSIEANTILIECDDLARYLGKIDDKVYVGGKNGGVFLGFHKPVITKLEEYISKKFHAKPKTAK